MYLIMKPAKHTVSTASMTHIKDSFMLLLLIFILGAHFIQIRLICRYLIMKPVKHTVSIASMTHIQDSFMLLLLIFLLGAHFIQNYTQREWLLWMR